VGDEAGPAKLTKVCFYIIEYTYTFCISFVSCLYEIIFQANSLGIKQISEDDLLEMIRTRPEGKAADIKPIVTKKSNVKKILSKSESDKSSPSPNKAKALLDSPKKIKTPSSPVKTSVKTKTSPISKQTSDISNDIQKVNLDINLTYMHIHKNNKNYIR